jgi:hypothetical protein
MMQGPRDQRAANPSYPPHSTLPPVLAAPIMQAPTNPPHSQGFDSRQLDGKSPEMQREVLGEFIYLVASRLFPTDAGKITGMLLEFSQEQLLPVLSSIPCLEKNIRDAHQLLHSSAALPPQAPFDANCLTGKSSAEQMLLIADFIRARAQQLYPTLTEQITRAILEFPLDMLLPVVTSPDNLVRNIKFAATHVVRF